MWYTISNLLCGGSCNSCHTFTEGVGILSQVGEYHRMALKAHKIALRPNMAQRSWFAQQCGYARFAFNSALADFKAGLDNGVFRSFIDLNNRWNQRKKSIDWTAEQDQRAALHGVRNLSDAVTRWRRKQNRFPRFKRRGCRQSYTVEGYQCSVEGKRIKLPKIGWVKMFSKLRCGNTEASHYIKDCASLVCLYPC